VFACHTVKDVPIIEMTKLEESCEIFISNEMMGFPVSPAVVLLVHEDCLVHFKNRVLQAYETFLREEKVREENERLYCKNLK
jgi:hypothetical protein